jgi:hypothetical protein
VASERTDDMSKIENPDDMPGKYYALLGIFFTILFVVSMFYGAGQSSKPERKTDREHIEGAAARLDAYCSSRPDKC